MILQGPIFNVMYQKEGRKIILVHIKYLLNLESTFQEVLL